MQFLFAYHLLTIDVISWTILKIYYGENIIFISTAFTRILLWIGRSLITAFDGFYSEKNFNLTRRISRLINAVTDDNQQS